MTFHVFRLDVPAGVWCSEEEETFPQDATGIMFSEQALGVSRDGLHLSNCGLNTFSSGNQ